jgi:hypothetical protein
VGCRWTAPGPGRRPAGRRRDVVVRPAVHGDPGDGSPGPCHGHHHRRRAAAPGVPAAARGGRLGSGPGGLEGVRPADRRRGAASGPEAAGDAGPAAALRRRRNHVRGAGGPSDGRGTARERPAHRGQRRPVPLAAAARAAPGEVGPAPATQGGERGGVHRSACRVLRRRRRRGLDPAGIRPEGGRQGTAGGLRAVPAAAQEPAGTCRSTFTASSCKSVPFSS